MSRQKVAGLPYRQHDWKEVGRELQRARRYASSDGGFVSAARIAEALGAQKSHIYNIECGRVCIYTSAVGLRYLIFIYHKVLTKKDGPIGNPWLSYPHLMRIYTDLTSIENLPF